MILRFAILGVLSIQGAARGRAPELYTLGVRRVALSRRVVILGILFALVNSAVASESSENTTGDNGRLCLAAAPTPTPSPRSLGNPTGDLPEVSYSIRIDSGTPVELSRSAGTWVMALPLNQRHSVEIFADKTPIESFYFRFEPSEATELCLFMKSLYQTWILSPLKKTGSWCSCGQVPAT